jgi:hypothetical protein
VFDTKNVDSVCCLKYNNLKYDEFYGRRINISDILQVQFSQSVISCTAPYQRYDTVRQERGANSALAKGRNEVRWDQVCCILYFHLICIPHNHLKSQLPTIRPFFPLVFFFYLSRVSAQPSVTQSASLLTAMRPWNHQEPPGTDQSSVSSP